MTVALPANLPHLKHSDCLVLSYLYFRSRFGGRLSRTKGVVGFAGGSGLSEAQRVTGVRRLPTGQIIRMAGLRRSG